MHIRSLTPIGSRLAEGLSVPLLGLLQGGRPNQRPWLGSQRPSKARGAGSGQTRRPWELVQTKGWSGSEKGARKGAGGRAASRPGMWLGHRQLLPKTRIAWGLHNPHLRQSGCPLPASSSRLCRPPPTPAPTLSPPPDLCYDPLSPSPHSRALLWRPHLTFQQTNLSQTH